MANTSKYAPLAPDQTEPTDKTNETPGTNDPKNKPGNQDEILNTEEGTVVNTDEQNEVVNEQETSTPPSEGAGEKIKGYQEGNKNDSLTEPEFRDSDDQLSFPEEEGK